MGRPDLATDARFKDIPSRATNAEELKQLVQDWVDSVPSDEEVMRLLEENRIPYAPVLTVQQAMAHPHLRERGTVRTVNDRFLGEFDVPGFPCAFPRFRRRSSSKPRPSASIMPRFCTTTSAIHRSASANSKPKASCIAASAEAAGETKTSLPYFRGG